MGFVPSDRGVPRLPALAAVEHAQHQDRASVVAVLECVRSTEYRQDDLAVLVTIAKWPSKLRMAPEHDSARMA